MTFAPRLLPLALTLLNLAMQSAYAAGAGSREPYSVALPLTAGANLVSQYVWRGIRESDGRPAAQVSLDYRRPGGWSAGTWASSVGDRGVFTRDFFGIAHARGSGYLDVGLRHDLGGATSLNLHAGDGRVAGNEGMDWRDLKAGLNRKFEGGWSLSGTYSRAFGAAGAGTFERYASAMPRTDLRPLQGSKSGRGAIVLSLSRRF